MLKQKETTAEMPLLGAPRPKQKKTTAEVPLLGASRLKQEKITAKMPLFQHWSLRVRRIAASTRSAQIEVCSKALQQLGQLILKGRPVGVSGQE